MTWQDAVQRLINDQGWNDSTLVGLILDMIEMDDLGERLAIHLEGVAALENDGDHEVQR